jgi:hypothetical protein
MAHADCQRVAVRKGSLLQPKLCKCLIYNLRVIPACSRYCVIVLFSLQFVRRQLRQLQQLTVTRAAACLDGMEAECALLSQAIGYARGGWVIPLADIVSFCTSYCNVIHEYDLLPFRGHYWCVAGHVRRLLMTGPDDVQWRRAGARC